MARQLNYAKRAIVPYHTNFAENPHKSAYLPVPVSSLNNFNSFQPTGLNSSFENNFQKTLFSTSKIINNKPPSKLKDQVERNNIDYLYKFVDIIEKDFQTLLEDSHLTHKSLKYLQTDVQTIFTIEHYKMLRKIGVLPDSDIIIGRKEFAKAVEKSIYHLKLLHTDCELNLKKVRPIPEKLQVEVRYSFRGMTRLPKNEVIIDFIVKFNFSKSSKQVHLIEFTDKHVKHNKSYGDVLKVLGTLAMPLFGIPTNEIQQIDLEEAILTQSGDLVTLEQLVNPIYVHK